MKRTIISALVVTLTVLTSVSIWASTVQTPVKWSQPPVQIGRVGDLPLYTGWDEPSWGFAVPPTVNAQAADDWQCRDNLPVTDIHWWGSYPGWRDSVPRFPISAFWFGIYSDVPAGPNDVSHPGELLWRAVSSAFTETFVGYDGRIDPAAPDAVVIDSTFQYNVTIPRDNWFFQQSVPGAPPTVYWLSIVAISPVTNFLPWGWKTRPHFYQDDAVTQTVFTGWQPLVGPDGQSWDMAFELTTVPEPASSIAVASAIAGLVGFARRKRPERR